MATTIATLTLTSADIKSDALSLTKSATLYKADSTTGLDETTGLNKVIYASTANVLLLDSTVLGVGKAAKVYIANKSTDASEYVDVQIHDQNVGRLYAGDWMFIPWNMDDATHDLEVTAYVGTNTIEWVKFHENETLATQGD